MQVVPSDWPEELPLPPAIPRRHFEDTDWIAAHLPELRRSYPDQWVAVYRGEVIAAGKDLAEVERVAHERTNERDIAIELVQSDIRFHLGWRLLPD